jgi:flavin reductase (DIM6/NTAB) family NADH-FMN oxidoreductase RutF
MEPTDFRRITGHFATGVTVITTANGNMLHGMTANAFMSVSLNPLLVLVSIDKAAHAHDEVEQTSRFAVNVLAESQQELSTLFAATAEPERDALRGAAFHMSPGGLPLLDGSIAYLECSVRERYAGGDHTLFLAEVTGGEITSDAPPLLFYQAKYRGLANLEPVS